jgi:solute:Na+ symporter, SSS family
MLVTFGLLLIFFMAVIGILQASRIKDRTFSDYAVADRSFDAKFQAMSFLNTWYPGAVFTAFGGMAASVGVVSFYLLTYSLLTIVVMVLLARPVWTWGKVFDLNTQPDLIALRYGSRHIRTLSAVLGILSGLPWLVLGMQALGTLFRYLSLGTLTFPQAVLVGVAVIAIRQIWTVRMGMRGVVISDMVQGVAAYAGGTLILAGLIAWLVLAKGITFQSLDPKLFEVPGIGSKEGPLYVFSLILTGMIGGWCWPVIFVRLFTADSVRSIEKSAALAAPASFVFVVALLVFGMLGSKIEAVAEHPSDVWFIVTQEAGGVWLLGLAGIVVLAASMGNIDGHIQATGAQIANDLIGNYWPLSHRALILAAKAGMLILTVLASWLACLELPALFSIAILAYQGVIQLAVPLFLGVFWQRGTKHGAIAGMIAGFAVVIALELYSPGNLPWAYGLTSGVIGLLVNLTIYVVAALIFPNAESERRRIEELFSMVEEGPRRGIAPAPEISPA